MARLLRGNQRAARRLLERPLATARRALIRALNGARERFGDRW